MYLSRDSNLSKDKINISTEFLKHVQVPNALFVKYSYMCKFWSRNDKIDFLYAIDVSRRVDPDFDSLEPKKSRFRLDIALVKPNQ